MPMAWVNAARLPAAQCLNCYTVVNRIPAPGVAMSPGFASSARNFDEASKVFAPYCTSAVEAGRPDGRDGIAADGLRIAGASRTAAPAVAKMR